MAGIAVAALAAVASIWAPPPERRPEAAALPRSEPQARRDAPAAEPPPRASAGVARAPVAPSRVPDAGAPRAPVRRDQPAPVEPPAFGTPRAKTPAELASEEGARDRARELGVELRPEVRQAIQDLKPLPGEEEPSFAERVRDVELDAITDEFLAEALLWQRYQSETFRLGDPTSQHRAEAMQRIAQMTQAERTHQLQWALKLVDRRASPRFWPPDQGAAYDGPGAEPPPANCRWVEPELYSKPLQ